MKAQYLKKFLADAYSDVTFKYQDIYCCIIPQGSDRFAMGYGDAAGEYESIDELMSARIFGGKTLTEIADDISELEMV